MTGAVQPAQQLRDQIAQVLYVHGGYDGREWVTCCQEQRQAMDHWGHVVDCVRAAGLLADTPPPGLVEALRAEVDVFFGPSSEWAQPMDPWSVMRRVRALLDRYADSTGGPS